MTLTDALNEIDYYYNKMRDCYSSSGRKYNEKKILIIMQAHPEVLSYWYYNPKKSYIVERFGRVQQMREQTQIAIVNHIVYDPSYQARNTPSARGVYFLGDTAFNPYTGEKQFWVKIGKSADMEVRLKKYDTHSPSIYHIDYLPCPNEDEVECKYHHLLYGVSLGRSERSKEWWLVDEATYLKMSALGFEFFDTI